MLIAVIRAGTGRGILHFAGETDAYNLEMLRDHVSRAVASACDAQLRINVDKNEEAAFLEVTHDWLSALVNAGVSVQVAPMWTKPARDAPASPG
jgi:hypothetical protein